MMYASEKRSNSSFKDGRVKRASITHIVPAPNARRMDFDRGNDFGCRDITKKCDT